MNRIFAFIVCVIACRPGAAATQPFGIQVVDEQTGRGVPLVELETVSRVRYVTDSAGFVAIDDPVLMSQKVFFTVSSLGYEFTPDGFGAHGRSLLIKPGGSEKLRIKRLNIAERLYRVTGEGIYRDSMMLGHKPPIANPLLNAQVSGQDSVQAIVYRDKLYLFWGDTSRPSHPLGLFRTAGATAELPGHGGLDPSDGIDLHYFKDADGFARAMVPGTEPGAVWVDGVFTVSDEKGRERMLAHAARVERFPDRVEQMLLTFDDDSQTFRKLKNLPLASKVTPSGHPFHVSRDGTDYVYFPAPYPCLRVRATWKDATDLASYEAYVPDSGEDARAGFKWKRGATPLPRAELEKLRDQSPFRLEEADTCTPVVLHGGSVNWNAYRKRWVMIGVQSKGASRLGEVWYAEAAEPEGPWVKARKIATHHRDANLKEAVPEANYDFYNPTQHPFFDQQNGRVIYFEGTYTSTFSQDPRPTPRYEYNQLMYRLDLADPRLKLMPASEPK